MKKFLLIIICFLMIFPAYSSIAAAPAIKVLINGKSLSDVKLINGQPYK